MIRAVTVRTRIPAVAATSPFRLLAATTRPFSSSTAAEESIPEDESIWNAFDVLGVPERFSIDEKELKTKYRALMGEYHPDRNQQANQLEQDLMREKSSAVTRAYQELTAAHTRAAHLMALRGKPMTESLSQQVVGMEFLMQVMAIREEIESISSDQDLRKLLQENDERMVDTCRAFEEALEQGDLDAALKHTARLQYWNRVAESIREKMDSVD